MKIQIIKRIVYAVLIILWMITIFEFSNQNGDTSQGTSDVITDKIIEINNNLENKRDQVSFCVRKLAHFSIYLIGGILAFGFFDTYSLQKKYVIAFALMFGIVYASLDEFHQSFISGRSAQMRDVCIDTCGVITGEIISCFAKKHKKLLKEDIKN